MKKILLSAILIVCSYIAHSSIITVTNTNDSGPGSLRQSIANAVNDDTVRISTSLVSGGNNTIVLTTGEITIARRITIEGIMTATDTVFISGNNSSRIFNTTGSKIYLSNLAIINGLASTNYGGGIKCTYANTLVINNSFISNNIASSGSGGGLFISQAGTVTINNSTISNNTGVSGGGIAFFTAETVIINNSTISGNIGGSNRNGGGIYITNDSQTATVTINNSTINNNFATYGGGINAYASATTSINNLTINNSTITGNTAHNGGGIYFDHHYQTTQSHPLTIKNSTITGNTVTNNGAGIQCFNPAYLKIGSSIVALNSGNNDIDGNIDLSDGYNIFSTSFSGSPLDQLNVDSASLDLGPLQYNGGNTYTRIPNIGSVAIDMGNPSDLSAAQNVAVQGVRRDVGAAENICITQKSTFVVACASYTSPSGNYTWTNSGIFKDTTSGNGCDTIHTINLSISNSTATINETACNTYTSPSGKVWTISNTYLDTITNNAGCDSIITINLTVNQSTSSSISPIVCESYVSPSGKILTASNTYLDTINNMAGCDSVITINLTVNQTYSTFTATSCGSYTTPSGKTITSSGVIMDTITNSNGCDSIMTITVNNTTINNSVNVNGITLSAAQSSAAYKWLNCTNFSIIPNETSASFTPTANGSYAVEITLNGCIDTSACNVIAIVGINEDSQNNTVLLFPNPTSDILNLKTENNIQKVQVISLDGSIVLTTNSNVFSIEGLTTGTYIVRVLTNKGLINKLVIKN